MRSKNSNVCDRIRTVSQRSYGTQAREDELLIDIARPSVLGNPFHLDHETGREAVIQQYRAWLVEQRNQRTLAWSEVLRIARLVRDGHSVALVCWCAPKACHGDIIVRAVKRILRK